MRKYDNLEASAPFYILTTQLYKSSDHKKQKKAEKEDEINNGGQEELMGRPRAETCNLGGLY